TLAEVENKAENCKKAISAYEAALTIYTLKGFPMQYAMTQNNLGAAYRTLAEVENKAENCKLARVAYDEALKIYTEEKFPEIYPRVAGNLQGLLDFCKDG
ncbi:MAG: tetratricopeptide repeat protein, partial [Chloroflexota bacterium]